MREDDSEYETYTDSGGKSGGQKEKLAYTVLAASLAYQFRLDGSAAATRTFRFVVIDEAFGRGSEDSARFALRLFHRLGLQLLIVTPLTFLGGSFYSIDMLPPLWQTVTLFNPVVYLISGFRWSFYGIADVSVAVSLAMTIVFMAISLAIVAWIFKTGYRLKT